MQSLFTRQLRQLARLQKAAVKLATGAQQGRKPPARKRPAVKKRAVGKAAGPQRMPPSPGLNDGAGQWQRFLYRLPALSPGFARQLSYAVYLPPGTPSEELPLVVMLHGCQQEMREFARGTRMNLLADAKAFAVLYVEQAMRHNAYRCWRWYAPAGNVEADAIAGIIREAVDRFGFDQRRVYVAGMSAGAGMAALVALRHTDLVSALAMHSGAVIGAAHSARSGLRIMRRGATAPLSELLAPFAQREAARRRMPALIVHGVQDEVVTVRNAEQLAAQFVYWNGLQADSRTTTLLAQESRHAYRRIDYGDGRNTVVRVCLVDELGHAWAGGDAGFRFNSATGPDASALIWRFFARHRRR